MASVHQLKGHKKTKSSNGAPAGVSIALLRAVKSGTVAATDLARQLGVTQPRVSNLAGPLIKGGWLKKVGAKYALTKRALTLFSAQPDGAPPPTKNITADGQSFVASGSAPAKDSQASDQTTIPEVPRGQNDFQLQRRELVGKLAAGRTSRSGAPEQKHRKRQRDLVYQREDWHLFLDPSTLPQKAGCYPGDICKIVLKELVDNALDVGANVELTRNDDGSWLVVDNGPGLSPSEIVKFFAVNRPLISSKLKRLPLRGMLGNGLRVVMGAVAAFGGSIALESRGRRLELGIDRLTGKTVIDKDEPVEKRPGTRISLSLPGSDKGDAWVAQNSIRIAACGSPRYNGMSNPHWYGARDLERMFAHVMPASTTVGEVCRDLGLQYDDTRQARNLSMEDIGTLLAKLQSRVSQIKPEQLGFSGPNLLDVPGYARKTGIMTTRAGAHIPYVVEAWASCQQSELKGQGDLKARVIINRSMTLARISGASYPKVMQLSGCGMHRYIRGPKTGDYTIWLSVVTPYVQLATDGKEPDLTPYGEALSCVIGKACGQAHHALGKPPGAAWTIKSAGWHVMAKAYADASGNGTYPAEGRQVMYAARSEVLRLTGFDKIDGNDFVQRVVRSYVAEHPVETADWDIVFNARGHFSEPHTNYNIGLGTVEVRDYLVAKAKMPPAVRVEDNTMYPTLGPENRYSAVLFVEKEGFDPLFASAKICERYDIGLMSTKGMSVAAARMLVDWLCAHGVKVLVLHDFDITGFKIFGTLGTDSKVYTFKNEVEVIDIGLRLKDAMRLNLQSEPVKTEGNWEKHSATLRRHGATNEEIDFLSDRRVELNAMTAPVFVQFLEEKFAEHGIKKMMPDGKVLEAHARRIIEGQLTKKLLDQERDKLKAEAAAMPIPPDLDQVVEDLLADRPELAWDMASDSVCHLQMPPQNFVLCQQFFPNRVPVCIRELFQCRQGLREIL
jgi:hypothetical protein